MPKALVEIGARPILWHVIEIYARQGFDRFGINPCGRIDLRWDISKVSGSVDECRAEQ